MFWPWQQKDALFPTLVRMGFVQYEVDDVVCKFLVQERDVSGCTIRKNIYDVFDQVFQWKYQLTVAIFILIA